MILQASQRGMDESTTPNINLRTDTGGIRFRRRLHQMIEAESADSASPAAGGHITTVPTTVSV